MNIWKDAQLQELQIKTQQIKKKFESWTVSSVGEVKQPKHTLAGLTHQPQYSHLPIQWLKYWKCLVSFKQLIMTNLEFWEHIQITAEHKFWSLVNWVQPDSVIQIELLVPYPVSPVYFVKYKIFRYSFPPRILMTS